MKFKLFGKDVFEFSTRSAGMLWLDSGAHLKKSKFLPDFYIAHESHTASDFIVVSDTGRAGGKAVAIPVKKKKPRIKLTPKGIYEMKMLNEKSFTLNVNKKYVDEQIQQFKDKLNLIKIAESDMTRGVTEIASVLIRLENRKKYSKFSCFFENYAYTTTSKIDTLVKKHNYLKIGKVEQFLADMPKEAIKEMKEYDKNTKKLCDKKPLFYIIADKKDFEKTHKRKDPILLAQSPFGHVWQILGAWDNEMLLLEEL